jgi:hypothetical protein
MNLKEFLKHKGLDLDEAVIYDMNNITKPKIPLLDWIKEFERLSSLPTDDDIRKESIEYGSSLVDGFKPWVQKDMVKIKAFTDGVKYILNKSYDS